MHEAPHGAEGVRRPEGDDRGEREGDKGLRRHRGLPGLPRQPRAAEYEAHGGQGGDGREGELRIGASRRAGLAALDSYFRLREIARSYSPSWVFTTLEEQKPKTQSELAELVGLDKTTLMAQL